MQIFPALNRNKRPNVLLHHVKFVLFANQSPNDGDIFNDDIYRNGAQGSENTSQKLHHSESVQGKRFDYPENVHVNVEPGDECTQKVHNVGTGNRIQSSKDHIRSGQWHRDPGVDAYAQQ